MLIGSRQRLGTYNTFPALTIDGSAIKQVKVAKSLGVHIDENLSWTAHIDKLSKKIAAGIGALKRSRPYVPQNTLQSIYNSLIQPHFDYCSIVWGHCNATLANKLQILQNRAARIFTFSQYDSSSGPLLDQLGWKRLDTQRQIQEATMVYKALHCLTPNYLSALFSQKNVPYNLRDCESKLSVPHPRTNFLINSFRYSGAVLWNSLPLELRQSESLNSFRKGCRSFLS